MLGVSIERKLESFNYSRGPKKEKLVSSKVGEQYSLLKPFSLPSDTALSFDSPNIHTSTAFPSVFQFNLKSFVLETCAGALNCFRGTSEASALLFYSLCGIEHFTWGRNSPQQNVSISMSSILSTILRTAN